MSQIDPCSHTRSPDPRGKNNCYYYFIKLQNRYDRTKNKITKLSNLYIIKTLLNSYLGIFKHHQQLGKVINLKLRSSGNDFISLQEIRKDVYLTGYRSRCLIRKCNKLGGVGFFIKNELYEGVQVIQNESCSDYIICKLKKEFLN